MLYYQAYVNELNGSLNEAKAFQGQKEISTKTFFDTWVKKTREVYSNRNTLYFIGNGASSMMAGHMAADANKNGKLRSLSFNDTANLTTISNDISYEEVFAFQLNRLGNPGDILITISSSGNSPNIIKAIETAKKIGLYVVTLSAINADNRSLQLGDLNIYVPAKTYGLAESAHQAVLHCWLDQYLDEYEGGRI